MQNIKWRVLDVIIMNLNSSLETEKYPPSLIIQKNLIEQMSQLEAEEDINPHHIYMADKSHL